MQRAPRHTPTLERLLDLSLGTGKDLRTAQLAANLEQIYRDREDRVNAERYAELRKRYQMAAGLTDEELMQAPKSRIAPVPQADVEPASRGAVPVEMSFEAEAPESAGSAPEFVD